MCVPVSAGAWWSPEDISCPGTGVIRGCESPDMGVGN